MFGDTPEEVTSRADAVYVGASPVIVNGYVISSYIVDGITKICLLHLYVINAIVLINLLIQVQ